MDAAGRHAGADTEQEVRKYFECRRGWTVRPLDTGKMAGRAPDFRICHGEKCFLCEVKTIESVRADIPYGPVQDYRVDERDKALDELDALVHADPDRRVIVTREHYEWLHANETEFRKSYSHTRRNTESQFRALFEQPLQQHFGACSVSQLPYDVSLHSDDVYVPCKAERHRFVEWLENEIGAIDRGELPDRRWKRNDGPHTTPTYSAHYPLHKPAGEYDTQHTLSVRLQRRGWTDDGHGLRLSVHCYGTLNVERVRASVEDAVRQLRALASREQRSRRLPRVVVLGFESGLHPLDDLQLLEEEIRGLFVQYDDLSAIAVLRWCRDGEPPWVPCFIVYHNGWVSESTEPLDPDPFTDNWSTHKRVGPQ